MPQNLRQAVAFLLGFWIALVVFVPLAAPRAFGATLDEQLAQLEAQLYADVNTFRREHRLLALERHAELDAVARAHSADMARRRFFSHVTPEGKNPVDRIQSARIDGFTLAGENVGMTSKTNPNQEILGGWIASKVHRENLEARPWNATGLGIARGPGGALYYTQLYVTFPQN